METENKLNCMPYRQEAIDIEFEVPFSIKKIFAFVAVSENMFLYKGYGLIPGIAEVRSSTIPRREGTIDQIKNTDGSSHKSTTIRFTIPSQYFVEISDIRVPGMKGYFSKTILGFTEEWNYYSAENNRTKIHRRLTVKYKNGWAHKILMKSVIIPHLEKSLHRHHHEIVARLSNSEDAHEKDSK